MGINAAFNQIKNFKKKQNKLKSEIEKLKKEIKEDKQKQKTFELKPGVGIPLKELKIQIELGQNIDKKEKLLKEKEAILKQKINGSGEKLEEKIKKVEKKIEKKI